MPYATALALDRVNEWLVRRRLSGRLAMFRGFPTPAELADAEGRVHPPIASLAELEPKANGTRLWRAGSSWPAASGENRVWYAERHVSPGDDPAAKPTPGRPAVILLHGWLMDGPQLMIYRSWAHAVAARGVDVWMPRLPHHMERTEVGEISGQRSLSPDIATSFDAVRQAVAETRLLAAWLRRNGASSVGLWGMSLGGWVASLAASLDEDWEAVALWAPVASPVEVLFESNLVELLRNAVVAGGLSAPELSGPEIDAMTPEACRLRIPRQRVRIVAAMYDQVIAPAAVVRMARRWGVDVCWVPHGHISLMVSRAPVHRTVGFLERSLKAQNISPSEQSISPSEA